MNNHILHFQKSLIGRFCTIEFLTDGETKWVAKKVYNQNREAARQLQNEARFSFHSPQLPKIMEYSELQNSSVLCKQFQEGINSSTVLHRGIGKKRNMLIQKAALGSLDVLGQIHQLGIVHGDIKPHNFLLSTEAEEPRFSLIDFGRSIRLNDQPRPNFAGFQVQYSAPEIILGHTHLAGPHSDLFSWALTIHNWQCREAAFSSEHPAVALPLMLNYPYQRADGMPKDRYETLKKLLQKPRFNKSPQQYSAREQEEILRENIQERQTSLSAIREEVEAWKSRNFLGF